MPRTHARKHHLPARARVSADTHAGQRGRVERHAPTASAHCAAAIALGGARAQSERCCCRAARGQRAHIHAHRRTALRLHQHQVMRIRLHPAWCADTSSVRERVSQWRSVSYAAHARIPQAKAARTCRGASILVQLSEQVRAGCCVDSGGVLIATVRGSRQLGRGAIARLEHVRQSRVCRADGALCEATRRCVRASAPTRAMLQASVARHAWPFARVRACMRARARVPCSATPVCRCARPITRCQRMSSALPHLRVPRASSPRSTPRRGCTHASPSARHHRKPRAQSRAAANGRDPLHARQPARLAQRRGTRCRTRT